MFLFSVFLENQMRARGKKTTKKQYSLIFGKVNAGDKKKQNLALALELRRATK